MMERMKMLVTMKWCCVIAGWHPQQCSGAGAQVQGCRWRWGPWRRWFHRCALASQGPEQVVSPSASPLWRRKCPAPHRGHFLRIWTGDRRDKDVINYQITPCSFNPDGAFSIVSKNTHHTLLFSVLICVNPVTRLSSVVSKCQREHTNITACKLYCFTHAAINCHIQDETLCTQIYQRRAGLLNIRKTCSTPQTCWMLRWQHAINLQ